MYLFERFVIESTHFYGMVDFTESHFFFLYLSKATELCSNTYIMTKGLPFI